MEGFTRVCLILLLLNWTAASLSAGGVRLYRYINGEGVVVIDDKIPPAYVAHGYDVLSSSGQLLDTVEPLQPQNAEEKALRKKVLAAREKEDRFILVSYSSVAEIEAAMMRKLGQLDREVKGINTNIKGSKKRIAFEQQRAANYQRGGRVVPKNVTETLSELELEVKESENLLKLKEEEYKKTEARYQGYIERYRQLNTRDEVVPES